MRQPLVSGISAVDHSRKSIQALVLREFSSKLAIEALDIDPAERISRYGLDSLIAFDLNDRIRSGLGVAIPASTILQTPSIRELAHRVLEAMLAATLRAPARATALSSQSDDDWETMTL